MVGEYSISNETRSSKGNRGTAIEQFARWVKEYAEAHDMSVDDVLKLALFRLEQEELLKRGEQPMHKPIKIQELPHSSLWECPHCKHKWNLHKDKASKGYCNFVMCPYCGEMFKRGNK